jgi:hypothetical protein
MSAVQARLHYSFKQELRLLAGIIRDYTDTNYEYEPDGDTDAAPAQGAKKEDYDHVDVIPVSDPNAATMSQRVVQYQAVMQMAQSTPDIYNMPQLHRNMLEILGIKNADKLVPLPDDMKPKDPVSENMAILKGEPVKAFQYQDHQAHIQVVLSMFQDPVVMQAIGQNPNFPKIQAAAMAHVAEHTGYLYRKQIEAQLGMPMPAEDEKLPEQIEQALSGMLAQAAQQSLQQNQQQAAQQQAQQQAQDPLVQMQQQELQLKQGALQIEQGKLQLEQQVAQAEMQLKQQQLAADIASKADTNKLKIMELQANMQLKGTQIGAQINESKQKQAFEQEHAGVQLGAQIAKDKRDQALTALQTAQQAATKGENE